MMVFIFRFNPGIKCHERHLKLAIGLQSLRDQERAYSGLCHSHKSLGNLQEALVYAEKRLVVAHELGNEAKAAAFGNLGRKNFCLYHFHAFFIFFKHFFYHKQEISTVR